MDDNVGLPVMESRGQACVQFQIMPTATKTAEEKKSLFFPYLRRDVTLKQEVQKQILYLHATDIHLYTYNFFEKKKKNVSGIYKRMIFKGSHLF